MSARRELLLKALTEHTARNRTPTVEELADLIEATLHDLPTTPYVAVLRLTYGPDSQQEVDAYRELAEKLKAEGAVSLMVVSEDVTLETLDAEQLLRAGLQLVDTIHRCPPEGSGVMPCCGVPAFEKRSERITNDPALVTCQGPS